MDNHRFSVASSVPSVSSNIRHALNPRGAKEKISPALQTALQYLRLSDLDALENHFINTDMFLKPWSHFRDTFLLVQPGSQPRASEPDKVRGMDILWFYTNFSDGELRYDARADDTTSLFTTDETQYGTYDTTHWTVDEHEKMLYAWLLQEFKVGKARNPWGYEYFCLKNVCTAWRNVFVPIVGAVRMSYDPRGRRHYGRLAKFIEERSPSRIAFPEGNLVVPQSASVYRTISFPRERGVVKERSTGFSEPIAVSIPTESATRKQEEAFERELRTTYPKYGQVVEKPKWHPVKFIADQKAKMRLKNGETDDAKGSFFGRNRSGRESPMFGCKGVDDPLMVDPVVEENRRSANMGPPSPKPLKKRDSRIENKVVMPMGMYGFLPDASKDKSALHGVTRGLELSDNESESETQDMISYLKAHEQDGEGTDNDLGFGPTHQRKPPVEVLSPVRGHPSAIPKPLFDINMRSKIRTNKDHEIIDETPASHPGREQPTMNYGTYETSHLADSKPSRMPSYSGTGYDREIGPPLTANKLHSTLEHNAYDSASRESSFVLSEIPEVAHPTECQDQHTGSGDSFALSEIPGMFRPGQNQDTDVPQHMPWPGFTPGSPDPLVWPGTSPTIASPPPTAWPRASQFDYANSPPPVPAKHPARTASVHSSTASDLPPPPSIPRLLGPRIISKENIRGHLAHLSRELSEETLESVRQREATSTPVPKLTPFNKNMFPRRQDRKGTPMGAWMDKVPAEGYGEYEMKNLDEDEKK